MEIFAAYDWKPFQSCLSYFTHDSYNSLNRWFRNLARHMKNIILMLQTMTINIYF
jgi:hypothetical protein